MLRPSPAASARSSTAYRDIFLGVKYILVPAVLVSMALVIANAISISVRERRGEMAVLKVLGFGPGRCCNWSWANRSWWERSAG